MPANRTDPSASQFSKRQLPLLAAAFLLLVGNLAYTVNLASRLHGIEQAIRDTSNASAIARAKQWQGSPGAPGRREDAATSDSRLQSSLEDLRASSNAMSGIEELKATEPQVTPRQVARTMDAQLAQEPSNPTLEMQQEQWLLDAASRTQSDNLPVPRGFDSRCQGKRCLVSANFEDSGAAEAWAMHYLLATGGTLLSGSRTVVVPTKDGTSELRLYLF